MGRKQKFQIVIIALLIKNLNALLHRCVLIVSFLFRLFQFLFADIDFRLLCGDIVVEFIDFCFNVVDGVVKFHHISRPGLEQIKTVTAIATATKLFNIFPTTFFLMQSPFGLYVKMFSYRKETSEETDSNTDDDGCGSQISKYFSGRYIGYIIV